MCNRRNAFSADEPTVMRDIGLYVLNSVALAFILTLLAVCQQLKFSFGNCTHKWILSNNLYIVHVLQTATIIYRNKTQIKIDFTDFTFIPICTTYVLNLYVQMTCNILQTWTMHRKLYFSEHCTYKSQQESLNGPKLLLLIQL